MFERDFVELNGLPFHYRQWPGARQPPLLLLHGLASTCHIWDLVAPELATAGFRVLALDQRGHGESAKPHEGYDFATVVSDLAAFIATQSLAKPVIVGHSWGGNVAVQYAATHLASPSGLVLVDGGFSELQAQPEMTWERAEQQLAPPDLTGLTRERFVEMAKQRNFGPIWSPAIEAAVLANFEDAGDGTIRPRLRRDRHMKVVRALWEQRVSQLYPQIECPALLLPAMRQPADGRGEEMQARKVQAVERALKLLRRGSVTWLHDSIHDVPLQRPAELAAAIAAFAGGLAG